MNVFFERSGQGLLPSLRDFCFFRQVLIEERWPRCFFTLFKLLFHCSYRLPSGSADLFVVIRTQGRWP
jgi:hypothetical protein